MSTEDSSKYVIGNLDRDLFVLQYHDTGVPTFMSQLHHDATCLLKAIHFPELSLLSDYIMMI